MAGALRKLENTPSEIVRGELMRGLTKTTGRGDFTERAVPLESPRARGITWSSGDAKSPGSDSLARRIKKQVSFMDDILGSSGSSQWSELDILGEGASGIATLLSPGSGSQSSRRSFSRSNSGEMREASNLPSSNQVRARALYSETS